MYLKKLSLLVGSLLLMLFMSGCKEDAPETAKPTSESTQQADALATEAKPVDLLAMTCEDVEAKLGNLAPTDGKFVGIHGLAITPEWDTNNHNGGCMKYGEPRFGVGVVDLSKAPEGCKADQKPFHGVKTCRGEESTSYEGKPTWDDQQAGWNWVGTTECCDNVQWKWVRARADQQLQCAVGIGFYDGPRLRSADEIKKYRDVGEEFCNAVKKELKFG